GRDRVATTRALALTTAERVVDGVHGDAAHVRALALPAVATRLADRHEPDLGVADRPDRGPAVDGDPPHLGGREAEGGEEAFLGDELDRRPGAAAELGAGARLQLDVVHHGADRDEAQRHRVAGPDLRALTAAQRVADAHPGGGDDVALLAVRVV